MPQPLSADVSGILEAHLDAVESALATAGQPRGTRKAIVDDLEAQILDMLTESTGARPATVADMEAILAKLDPPQAYATGRPLPVPPRPRAGKTKSPQDWPRALALMFLMACGAGLIMWPSFSDFLSRRQVAEVIMQRKDLTSISFSAGEITGEARFGFWLTGTVVLVAGAIAATTWRKAKD